MILPLKPESFSMKKKFFRNKIFHNLVGIFLLIIYLDGIAQSIPSDSCDSMVFGSLSPSTPSEEFSIVNDGNVVLHESTGLQWQRCSIGQSWDGSTCAGTSSKFTWQEALDVSASFGAGWRLPSIKELIRIVERCRRGPAINRNVFPNTPYFISAFGQPGEWYWSSSADWAIDFGIGRSISFLPADSENSIRLVRNGSDTETE